MLSTGLPVSSGAGPHPCAGLASGPVRFPLESEKAPFSRGLLVAWCPGLDSNQHSLSATRPSSVRVYQFHHLGIGPPSHGLWRSRGGKYRSARESVRKHCPVSLVDALDSAGAGPFRYAKRRASSSFPGEPCTRRARRPCLGDRALGRYRSVQAARRRILRGRVPCSRGCSVPCGSALLWVSGGNANLFRTGSRDNTH